MNAYDGQVAWFGRVDQPMLAVAAHYEALARGGGANLEFEKKLIPSPSVLPDDDYCALIGEKAEEMQGMPGLDI